MVGADAVRCFVIGRICKTGWRGNVEITQHPWTKMVAGLRACCQWVDLSFQDWRLRFDWMCWYSTCCNEIGSATNPLRAGRFVIKYLEIGQLSQYSDDYGLKNRGSLFRIREGADVFCCAERPDPLWGQNNGC